MPEPVWTVTQAGTPEANGDYFPDGTYAGRPCFQKVGGGAFLFWYEGLRAYFLYHTKTDNMWYWGKDKGYDLPANPWRISGGSNPGAPPIPVLSAYEPPPPPPRPSASLLLTEGLPDPTDLRDPTPTLSWTYLPSESEAPQDAYQIRLASSQALLDAGNPDIWDSGIVESAATEVVYPGDALAGYETYFWTVRVRDTAGIWSEDW